MKNFRNIFVYSFALMAIFLLLFFVSNNVIFAVSKVNINTASVTELDTLPGIGPAKAQAIIEYRNTNGSFVRVEDLINVSGIGGVIFENVKDLITVGDSVIIDDTFDEEDNEEDTLIATTTTETPTSTVSTVNNSQVIYSVHYIQEELSDYEPTNVFKVSAGRDRLAYTDLPIKFEAKSKISKDLENRRCNYLWTFGDGFSLSGEKVDHTYKHAGDYNVVLNGKCGDLLSVSRTSVKAVKPDLLLSLNSDRKVEILNKGQYEINLYGWKLVSENQEYIFPQDTIISAGKNIIFPTEYLDNLILGNNISLISPIEKKGRNMTHTNSQIVISNNNFTREMSAEDFQKFVLEYKKLTQANSSEPLSVVVTGPTNANNFPVSVPGLSITAENNIPLTASALSAITSSTGSDNLMESVAGEALTEVSARGFWGKLFHPIQTIKKSFYK